MRLPATLLASAACAALAALVLVSGSPVNAAQENASAQPPGALPARASLLPLAQPLWSELNASHREILAPLAPQWNALPSTSKKAWLKLAERVPKMRGADREKALERIREWASLTPEQRRLARNNYRLARKLERDEIGADWEQYSRMTPEQRAVLRTSGTTSNTAARHAGASTGLAKEAARPLPRAASPQHATAQRPGAARN
ncbi:MAG TPA: DUF3106 domain-containing protein [Burkholderiaceae bacterium]